MSLDRRLFSLSLLGAAAMPGAVRARVAQSPATLVELFTSQGCSSCPPADALMQELATQDGIIPLSYPVEIWDYIGWKDTLAKPMFTRRQRAYAAMLAGKRVYTPQAVINGRAHCIGSDRATIKTLQRNTAPESQGCSFEVSPQEDGWSARLAVSNVPSGTRLWLLPFIAQQQVAIGRGENTGRILTYTNVVRDILGLGIVDAGEKAITIRRSDLAAQGADGFALLLQSGSLEAPGAVLGVACAGPSGIKL